MLYPASRFLACGWTRATKLSYSAKRVLFKSQLHQPQQQARCLSLSPILNEGDDKGRSRLYADILLEDLGNREFESRNAFKIFNLEEKLLIDERKLKIEYHKMLKLLHPDKYMQVGKETHDKCAWLTTLVTESYQKLRNPYSRATFLLSLKWGKHESEIERLLDELKMDTDFLTRMMRTRERIDEEHQFELEKLSVTIECELDELLCSINKKFKAKEYESILEKLARLKFLANCYMAVQNKLGDFGNY